jgi:hypothetical protein
MHGANETNSQWKTGNPPLDQRHQSAAPGQDRIASNRGLANTMLHLVIELQAKSVHMSIQVPAKGVSPSEFGDTILDVSGEHETLIDQI